MFLSHYNNSFIFVYVDELHIMQYSNILIVLILLYYFSFIDSLSIASTGYSGQYDCNGNCTHASVPCTVNETVHCQEG